MSLRFWLPFNGNLTNNGIDNSIITSSSTSLTYGDGKVCTSAWNSSSAWLRIPYNYADTNEITIAFWVKPNSPTSWSDIFSFGGDSVANRIEFTSGTNYTWYCSNTAYTLVSSGTSLFDLTNAVWSHIAIVANGSTVKFYKNGALVKSVAQANSLETAFVTSNDFLISTRTTGGGSRYYSFINDFRIYDNALSTKEVKLLSQGLVAHYQLKGSGRTNYLKGSGKYTKDNPLIRTSADSGNYNDSYIYHNTSDLSVTVTTDGTYTWVLESDGVPLGHNPSNIASTSRGFSMWLQNTSTSSHYCWSNFGTGASGEHYGSITIPAGTYRIRTNLYANDSVKYTVKMWNMKLVSGTYDPSDIWCPNEEDPLYNKMGFGSGTERDVSGFGNDGEKNTSFEVVNGSPRYGTCHRFAGSQYINCGRGAMVKDAITVSCWAYSDDWTQFSSQRVLSCTESGGWNMEPSGNYLQFACGTGESSCTYKSATSDVLLSTMSGWHMITGTYDGYNTKVYVDGILRGTNAAYTTKTPIFYNATNSFFIGAEAGSSATTPAGNYFIGNISDVRIYGTALSASDIADLYGNSASLTKDGKLMAYEFRENKRNTIDRDGTASTRGFNDKAIPTYDMKIKALDDGSTWARIHHLDVSNDKTFFADSSEVAKCLDKHNRYSRMGIASKYKAPSKVVAKNMLSGVYGTTGFNSSSYVTADTTIRKYNSASTKIAANASAAETTVGSSGTYALDSTHIYYARFEYYQATAVGGVEFFFPVVGGCSFSGSATAGKWTPVSSRFQRSNQTTGNYAFRLDFNNSKASGTTWYDGLMLIDLTSTFGSGYEPTKAWCDANIPYFTGTIGLPNPNQNEYEYMLTYPSMSKTLPAGYTQLEYIESTGTQWINTGVTGGARWEFDIQFTDTTQRKLMGYGGNGSEYWGCQDNGKYGVFNSWTIGEAGNRDTIVHDYTTSSGGTLWAENESMSLGATDVTSKEYQLFNIMSSANYGCHAKLWRCRCIQSGSLIRDFVPAMRNSDDVIGLYDVVNGVFYTNAGTGYFLCNYSWLDYIQSAGDQYIDTGFTPTQDTRVVMDYYLSDSAPNGGWAALFSSRNDACNANCFSMFMPNAHNTGYSSYGSEVLQPTYDLSGRHIVDMNKNQVFVDGALLSTHTAATFTGVATMRLFRDNSPDGGNGHNAVGKIYSCKIYDNGTLVRDFVPCNYGGSIGLWDNVNHAFYANSGSDSFTVGYKGSYQWLNYIESSGTQYINTGFKPTNNTRIVIRSYSTGNYSVYGTISTVGDFNLTAGSGVMYFYWAELGKSTTGDWLNAIHTFEQNKNLCYVDGNLVHTYTNTTWSSSYPIYLFGRNNAGSLNDAGGTVRIYSCQIYENDTLMRDYVPCVNPAGKVGLYDKVTKRFYGNGGTGNFIAGTTTESLPLYNRWVQTSAPSETSVSGFKALTTAWTAHNSGIRTHGTSALYDCDSGSTWYAPIGQYVVWSNGIPAADGTAQTETELWIRTDRFSNANDFKIYNGSMTATDYIEI